MKPFLRFLLPLLSLPAVVPAAEQTAAELEPMVVTAARLPVPLKETGSSISVITAEDIARRQLFTVADILRNVPGVDVVQTGGLGRTTSVFMRGANSNHTLVLIDGIEVNDPSSPGAAFDFANLTVDNIERIEVLRGAQSTLYGSDAIGGVINIITRRGKGRPTAGLSAEGGSFGTWKVGGSTAGSIDHLRWSASASHLSAEGFSAADDRLGNSEDDGYDNTTVSARGGWQVLENRGAIDNFDLDAAVRFHHSETDLDDIDFSGTPFDDPNYTQETTQVFSRLQGTLDLFDHFWRQILRISHNHTQRQTRDPNVSGSSFKNSNFRGEKFKLDWQNTLNLVEWDTLLMGITTETEWMNSDTLDTQSATINGYYGENRLKLFERSVTTAGIRVDDHDEFGDKLTWRVTQAILIPETGSKLRGSYGKGFKAPSLSQLFDPQFGNPRLKPETSIGWDVGIDQTFLADRIQASVSYFHNNFSQLIGSDANFRPINVNKARTNGVETVLEIRPVDILTLRGTYTYTRTEDNKEQQLFRRPRHKGSFDADIAVTEAGHLHVNVLMVGSRRFSNFSVRQELDPYVLVNLAGNYRLTDFLTFYGRIDNVLDTEYSEVPGYGTSRVAGYGGFRLTF